MEATLSFPNSVCKIVTISKTLLNCHYCRHKCHTFFILLHFLAFFSASFNETSPSPQPTSNPTYLLDWFIFITRCSHSPSFVNFFQMSVSKTVWIIHNEQFTQQICLLFMFCFPPTCLWILFWSIHQLWAGIAGDKIRCKLLLRKQCNLILQTKLLPTNYEPNKINWDWVQLPAFFPITCLLLPLKASKPLKVYLHFVHAALHSVYAPIYFDYSFAMKLS